MQWKFSGTRPWSLMNILCFFWLLVPRLNVRWFERKIEAFLRRNANCFLQQIARPKVQRTNSTISLIKYNLSMNIDKRVFMEKLKSIQGDRRILLFLRKAPSFPATRFQSFVQFKINWTQAKKERLELKLFFFTFFSVFLFTENAVSPELRGYLNAWKFTPAKSVAIQELMNIGGLYKSTRVKKRQCFAWVKFRLVESVAIELMNLWGSASGLFLQNCDRG